MTDLVKRALKKKHQIVGFTDSYADINRWGVIPNIIPVHFFVFAVSILSTFCSVKSWNYDVSLSTAIIKYWGNGGIMEDRHHYEQNINFVQDAEIEMEKSLISLTWYRV